ncbi:hypothetical protein AAF712_015417 [Marasmius tenuissimus]|uniref:Uncharacterized protein n=1 Tax=Marasmius tenuissimus TaxID=585030 RepID=A0ABR2Z9L1_9AGAR
MTSMDPFYYRPESILSPMISKRNSPKGLYDHIGGIIRRMGKSALCHAEYDVDFFKRSGDNWSTNFTYRTSDNLEFSANVFGEIAGGRCGTLLGPKGNHFPGVNPEDPNPITDATPVKQVIVIGKPSYCPDDLEAYFHNQIVVLDEMRRADEREEMDDSASFDVKEIIKGYTAEDDPCLITLHGSQLYTVEKDSLSGAKSGSRKPMRKRRANGSNVIETHESISAGPSAAGTPARSVEDATRGRPLEGHDLPSGDRIRVGAKYSPWVLPGYGGSRFRQHIAQVIQLDWRNLKGELIPPWNVWDELRPGTLIMANVVFHIYVMPGRDPSKPKKKVYQAVIKTLRVIGRSDIEVTKPVLQQDASVTSQPSGEGDDAAFKALSGLVLPDDVLDDADSSDRGSEGSRSTAGREEVDPKVGVKSSDVNGTYLEDTEDVFAANSRKSKKAKRG